MKVRQRIRQAIYAAYATWKGPGYDFGGWANRTFWGIDNSQLATNENIFSVVSRLTNTLSVLPIKLHKNHDIVSDHAAIDILINEPNQNMSGYELMRLLEVNRHESGNGYAIIMRDVRMQPEQIIPVSSDYVTPFINNDDGFLWYEVRGQSQTMYVSNLDMIHVKHIHGPTSWQGLSPLKVLKNTLEYDKAVQEFSLTEMQKKESFILKYGANVSEEKQTAIIANFKRFYAENGGIIFQEPGVEIDKLTKNYFSSDTISSEKITRSRVANVYNVPVSFLNESGGTASTSEQEMIQFVNMNLSSTVRQYEHEFNRKLLTKADKKQGFYFKFNLGGLLRGDTATRGNYYQIMLRSGVMTQDEVRALEDLAPKGGNSAKQWISGDLYPIDMDVKDRKSAATAVTVEGGENSE